MTSEPARGLVAARRLLAAAGLGLALAAIWLEVTHGTGEYWDDRSTGVFLLVLALLCALLIAASLLPGRRLLLGAAACVGSVLWGFYLFLPALEAFDRLHVLALGSWLGIAGGLLLVVAAAPVAELRARGNGVGPEPPALAISRLLSGSGFVLVALSIWFTAAHAGGSDPLSIGYWDYLGRHSLGIFILFLSGLGLALVALATLTRAMLPEGLALGSALILLGLSAFYPVALATGYLGNMRVGGWLALAGSLVAAVGSAATLALESRTAHAGPDGAGAVAAGGLAAD